MSTFVKGPGASSTPFGKKEYLRSTRGTKFESYTLAASTVPAKTIDGNPGQKILQPGTVLAKITSGPETGKVGPYCGTAGTKEVQTLTKAGTVSGGHFTLSFNGGTTGDIAWDAVAADVAAALNALAQVQDAGGVTVTGGPIASTPFSVTFGNYGLAGDVPQMTSDATDLTGAGAGVTVATGTGGVAGATDGRQTLANVVGLNDTFLPWQLMERDVEVAALYTGVAVQAWCVEYDAAGNEITLTNTTRDGMRSVVGMDILFK